MATKTTMLTRMGGAAMLALAMGLTGGCGAATGSAEASTGGANQKLPITVVNQTRGDLERVAMEAGKYKLSFGQVGAGGQKTLSLPEGERPAKLEVAWRDDRGQQQYATLTIGSASVSTVAVVIERPDRASLSLR